MGERRSASSTNSPVIGDKIGNSWFEADVPFATLRPLVSVCQKVRRNQVLALVLSLAYTWNFLLPQRCHDGAVFVRYVYEFRNFAVSQ